ncbi:hypothetical protein D9M71_510490 [compost metagenome]
MDNGSGVTSAVRPSTASKLNRLLPITVPTAISRSPRRAAMSAAANSGSEVQMATTVRPMMRSDSPRSVATSTAASSSRWPARFSRPRPASTCSSVLDQKRPAPLVTVSGAG